MKVLQPFQSHFVQLDACASATGGKRHPEVEMAEIMSEIVFLGSFFKTLQLNLFKLSLVFLGSGFRVIQTSHPTLKSEGHEP